jgi:hypothetical protein
MTGSQLMLTVGDVDVQVPTEYAYHDRIINEASALFRGCLGLCKVDWTFAG